MIYTPRRQSLVILITTALLTTLAGAATLTLFMPESQAQMRSLSEVSIKLVVANPAIESSDKGTAADGNARRLKHAEITRLIAKSIEKRLTAAGVKQFNVETKQHGILIVTAHTMIERSALSALITSPGKLEIRPVVQSGSDWQSIASSLPSGIELRQDIESLDPQNAYLWSANHRTINDFLDQISSPATLFNVYPEDGGWRSLTLGEPVATQHNLTKTQSKSTPTGVPFISMEFRQAFIRDQDREMALVLDGEVITKINANYERAITRLELTTPSHIESRDARIAWVTQVNGRLAAYLPLVVAEVKD